MDAHDPGLWEQVAKYLWGILVPAGWWIFNKQDKRMDSLEEAMKTKADNAEMDRQRDHIEKIFDKIEEVKKEVSDKHAELLTAIYESRK